MRSHGSYRGGRLATWRLPYGLARPALGPLTAFNLRQRVPLIDVGTIAAVKRGDIAVKPAVARLPKTGALFADGDAREFDAVVLATGYRPALEDIVVAAPGVLDDEGCPRNWTGVAIWPVLRRLPAAIDGIAALRSQSRPRSWPMRSRA